jgi:hypothetical protein
MRWRAVLILGVTLTVGACASAPRGPSVMVLPGTGKSLEQFQVDDTACRQWAAGQMGAAGGDSWVMQRSYDIAYQQCMYSRGNQIPGGPAPAPSGPPAPPPPPPPPGAPPRR